MSQPGLALLMGGWNWVDWPAGRVDGRLQRRQTDGQGRPVTSPTGRDPATDSGWADVSPAMTFSTTSTRQRPSSIGLIGYRRKGQIPWWPLGLLFVCPLVCSFLSHRSLCCFFTSFAVVRVARKRAGQEMARVSDPPLLWSAKKK